MKLNAQAKLLRQKHTSIKECVVGGTCGVHYTVWFNVGVQSFCVTSYACDTRKEAEWFRDRLAHALAVMVSELEKK